jgi:hydrogenase expression/formation protein HypD
MPGERPDAQQLVARVHALFEQLGRDTVRLMEVCGTHTMAIARAGLRGLLPDGLELISGPGCPVCVTSTGYVDAAVALAARDDVIITTFGDMVRVPGSDDTLETAKARGADVRIVYSPMNSLEIAAAEPDRAVVFLGVGFETTAPAVATLVKAAAGVDNVTVLAANKLIPPALRAIVADPALAVDGFFLPGHVSVVLGETPYRFIAGEFGRPAVITGFEPTDVLRATVMMLEQMIAGEARVDNEYGRIVKPEGNAVARERIDEVFEVADTSWRGFGVIPASGLAICERFAYADAEERFGIEISPDEPETGCRCGDVLKGVLHPTACPLFATRCTETTPVGPCMVSSEGACAAAFRYERT